MREWLQARRDGRDIILDPDAKASCLRPSRSPTVREKWQATGTQVEKLHTAEETDVSPQKDSPNPMLQAAAILARHLLLNNASTWTSEASEIVASTKLNASIELDRMRERLDALD